MCIGEKKSSFLKLVPCRHARLEVPLFTAKQQFELLSGVMGTEVQHLYGTQLGVVTELHHQSVISCIHIRNKANYVQLILLQDMYG